jgi:hypothetical protein
MYSNIKKALEYVRSLDQSVKELMVEDLKSIRLKFRPFSIL